VSGADASDAGAFPRPGNEESPERPEPRAEPQTPSAACPLDSSLIHRLAKQSPDTPCITTVPGICEPEAARNPIRPPGAAAVSRQGHWQPGGQPRPRSTRGGRPHEYCRPRLSAGSSATGHESVPHPKRPASHGTGCPPLGRQLRPDRHPRALFVRSDGRHGDGSRESGVVDPAGYTAGACDPDRKEGHQRCRHPNIGGQPAGRVPPPRRSGLRGHPRPSDSGTSSLTHTCPEHVAAQVLSVRRVSGSAERVPIPDQGGLGGATARCASPPGPSRRRGRTVRMPLSRDEQRLLARIETGLRADDPAFAAKLRARDEIS
jgi:hypothetical protein